MVRRCAPLLALVLGACAPAPARQASPGPGPSIVSLNPCTDAILAEVADPAQILALSAYSRDPAASSMDVALARRFRAVSGTAEEIAALRPDVVVGGTYMPQQTVSALARLGFRVERLGAAGSIAESEAQVRALAALAGHPDRGAALIGRIEAALAAARPPAGAPVPAIVWQQGGIVAGGDTLISDLLGRTGFANAAAARGMKQAQHLPLEDMLANPPSVILAVAGPAAGQDRALSHPALASLRQTRVVRLDPALLWCGGPTIARAAQSLGAARRAL